MARTDLYEKYPLLLEAEMAELDLSLADAAVRKELVVAYNAEKRRQSQKAAEDAAFRAAQRHAWGSHA